MERDEVKMEPKSLQDNIFDASIAESNKLNAEIDLSGQQQLQRKWSNQWVRGFSVVA